MKWFNRGIKKKNKAQDILKNQWHKNPTWEMSNYLRIVCDQWNFSLYIIKEQQWTHKLADVSGLCLGDGRREWTTV